MSDGEHLEGHLVLGGDEVACARDAGVELLRVAHGGAGRGDRERTAGGCDDALLCLVASTETDLAGAAIPLARARAGRDAGAVIALRLTVGAVRAGRAGFAVNESQILQSASRSLLSLLPTSSQRMERVVSQEQNGIVSAVTSHTGSEEEPVQSAPVKPSQSQLERFTMKPD